MGLFRVIVSVGFFISLAFFAASAQKTNGGAAKTAKPTIVEPKVEPITSDGIKVLISRQTEKPLLVNFWATWCDPCRDEFPDLVKIDSEFRPKSLNFVTVSLDDVGDIRTTVPQFLASMKASMPAYLLSDSDPEPAINAVDPKWQGDLPATFLYNGKGEVVYKHFGRVNPAELRQAIERLLAN